MNKLSMLLAIIVIHHEACAGTTGESLYGNWAITGVADAQEITSLSSDDADKLTGKTFVVQSSEIRFDGETCLHPQFKKSSQSTESFFRREYKMTPKKLRLPNPVTEVEVTCDAPSEISFIYRRNKGEIVIFWNGFFLNAQKSASTGGQSRR